MVVRVPNKAALRTPPKRPGRAELLAAVKGEAVNIRSPQGASGAASGPLYVPGLRVGGSQTKDKGFAGPWSQSDPDCLTNHAHWLFQA